MKRSKKIAGLSLVTLGALTVAGFTSWQQHHVTAPVALTSTDDALAPSSEEVARQAGSAAGYALLFEQTISMGTGQQERPVSIGLSGTLQTAIVSRGPDGFVLGGAIVDATLRGQPFAGRFLAHYDARGHLLALRARKGDDDVKRGFYRVFATEMQSGSLTPLAEEPAAAGTRLVTYRQSGSGVERKTMHYTKLATAGGLRDVETFGSLAADESATIVARDGMLERLDAHSALDFGAATIGFRTRSDLHLSLTRTAGPREEPALVASFLAEELEPIALGVTGTTVNPRESLLAGRSYEDMASELARLGPGDGAARAKLLSSLGARLEASPEATSQAVERARHGDADTAGTMIGALASAHTVEAERGLVSLSEDTKLDHDRRTHAIAGLALNTKPSSESMTALQKLSREDTSEIGTTATLGLGAVAGHLGGSPAAAEAVDDLLARYEAATTEEEKDTLLRALGNAGDARALTVIRAALGDASARLRATAASTLRFVKGEAVDDLLDEIAGKDETASVRIAALATIALRDVGPHVALLTWVLQRDTDEHARVEAVSTMARAAKLPKVRAALEAARNDPSADVREAVTRALAV